MEVPVYRSRYRAPWYGILMHEGSAGTMYMLIIRDKRGNPPCRRMLVALHPHWLVKTTEKFDTDKLNPDWLTLIPTKR